MVVFKSSSVNRLGYPRGIGVYPVYDVGVLQLASNTTLSSATTDTLQLCYIPVNSFISDWKIFIPVIGTQASLVFKLVDNLTTVTTYMTGITTGQGGGIISMEGAAGTTGPDLTSALNIGTNYAATARTLGTAGPIVAVWTTGAQLQLVVTTTSTASSGASALNLIYMVEFSPVYDAGV